MLALTHEAEKGIKTLNKEIRRIGSSKRQNSINPRTGPSSSPLPLSPASPQSTAGDVPGLAMSDAVAAASQAQPPSPLSAQAPAPNRTFSKQASSRSGGAHLPACLEEGGESYSAAAGDACEAGSIDRIDNSMAAGSKRVQFQPLQRPRSGKGVELLPASCFADEGAGERGGAAVKAAQGEGLQAPAGEGSPPGDLAATGAPAAATSSARGSAGCTWRIYLAVRFEKSHMLKSRIESNTYTMTGEAYRQLSEQGVEWITQPGVRVPMAEVLPPPRVQVARARHGHHAHGMGISPARHRRDSSLGGMPPAASAGSQPSAERLGGAEAMAGAFAALPVLAALLVLALVAVAVHLLLLWQLLGLQRQHMGVQQQFLQLQTRTLAALADRQCS